MGDLCGWKSHFIGRKGEIVLKIHVVQKDETLWTIAQKYNVSVEEVIAANTQVSDPNMVMPGMKITVPIAYDHKKQSTKKAETKEKKESKPKEQLKQKPKQQPKQQPKHILPAINEDEEEKWEPLKKEMPALPLHFNQQSMPKQPSPEGQWPQMTDNCEPQVPPVQGAKQQKKEMKQPIQPLPKMGEIPQPPQPMPPFQPEQMPMQQQTPCYPQEDMSFGYMANQQQVPNTFPVNYPAQVMGTQSHPTPYPAQMPTSNNCWQPMPANQQQPSQPIQPLPWNQPMMPQQMQQMPQHMQQTSPMQQMPQQISPMQQMPQGQQSNMKMMPSESMFPPAGMANYPAMPPFGMHGPQSMPDYSEAADDCGCDGNRKE